MRSRAWPPASSSAASMVLVGGWLTQAAGVSRLLLLLLLPAAASGVECWVLGLLRSRPLGFGAGGIRVFFWCCVVPARVREGACSRRLVVVVLHERSVVGFFG